MGGTPNSFLAIYPRTGFTCETTHRGISPILLIPSAKCPIRPSKVARAAFRKCPAPLRPATQDAQNTVGRCASTVLARLALTYSAVGE